MNGYKDIFKQDLKAGHFYIEISRSKHYYVYIVKVLDIKKDKTKNVDYLVKNSLIYFTVEDYGTQPNLNKFHLNQDKDKTRRTVISTGRFYYIPLTKEFEDLVNANCPGILKYD